MSGKYILDKNGEPKLLYRETRRLNLPMLHKWGKWFEGSRKERVVKQEMVGKYWVSTIFLSLDHSWGEGPPILWETMVFAGKSGRGKPVEDMQARCAGGREQAETMHARMVARMRQRSGYLNAKK